MRVNAYDFPGHNHATVFDGVQFGQNEWQFVDLCRSHLMVKRCGQNQTSNKKKWVCQWFVYYHILAWSMSTKKRGCVNHRRNSTKQSNHQPSHIMTDCTHSIRSSQIDFIYRRWPSDTRIDINL